MDTILESMCNDPFSHFEQQTSILEKTGRSDGPHDGPSRARRTVAGSRFKTLKNLKLGTENQLSELRNGVAGRTVTGHSPKIKFLNYATDSRTDRRRRDGPSQTVQSQSGSDFLIRFKGRF